MLTNKIISIIIPCYGTEKYIDRCLNSILNQTYKNLEIILVNDASKGNMQEILDSYKAKDERIKVFTHDENMGLFRTRVDGSKIATGDYIAFVDSDDYVEADYFREQLMAGINYDADIVMSNFVNDNAGNKYIYNWMFADARNLIGGG